MFRKLKIKFIIFKETFQRRMYYWKESKYFIEWDFSSILLAEKAVIKRMYDTFNNTDEMNDRQLQTLRTALNLLDIVLGDTPIAERTEEEKIRAFPEEIGMTHNYRLLRKVNTRNANRFVDKYFQNLITKEKEEPLFLEDYYQQKAFYIYNEFKTQYLMSWWT